MQKDFYKMANNELPKNIMKIGLTPEDIANTVKFIFALCKIIWYNIHQKVKQDKIAQAKAERKAKFL